MIFMYRKVRNVKTVKIARLQESKGAEGVVMHPSARLRAGPLIWR